MGDRIKIYYKEYMFRDCREIVRVEILWVRKIVFVVIAVNLVGVIDVRSVSVKGGMVVYQELNLGGEGNVKQVNE